MKYLLAVLLSLVLGGICFAEEKKVSEEISWTQKTPPRFEDFPAVPGFFVHQPVDLSSHPFAKKYRTRIKNGVKKGPNFSGDHAIVEWGCGTGCQIQMLVDMKTGKVHPTIDHTERGVSFQLRSRLFIADPPNSPDSYTYADDPGALLPVRYYVLQGHELKLIYSEPCMVVNRKQICGR